MATYKPVVFSPGNPVTAADLNILKDNIESVRTETKGLTSTITTANGQIKNVQNRIKAGQEAVKGIKKDTPLTKQFYFGTNFPDASPVFVVVSIFGEIKATEDIDISVTDSNASSFTVRVKSNLDRETLNFNYIAVAQVATS